MADERSPRLNVHGPELAAADHGSQNLMAATPDRSPLDRSTFIGRAVVGATGVLLGGTLAGWGQASPASDRRDEDARGGAAARRKVLIAYFSRAGENYYYGGRRDLKIGNTEVLATMIAKHIAADVYRIRAASPYQHDYEATVARNVREQNADARPRIANPLKSIEDYHVVLLGSPIWNVRPPMIMSTFAERFDFSGKTIHPFVTYAVSDLGTTMETYRDLSTGARISAGLAVRGETVRQADPQVRAWLRRINLLR
jgi:flavodoxin